MTAKILFVDDEINILAAFQRQLRKQFAVFTAEGGEQGLRAISEHGPFAVVVSDLRMPGIDGIQFLSIVKEKSPDTVRIMLTGNADLSAAIGAVNKGNIFRLLTKPCEQLVLVGALSEGIRQYRLITAERVLLEKTLHGSIKVLSEILHLLNPEAFGRATRITRYARDVASVMRVEDMWQIETAAALSQIGCVILPETAIKKLYNGHELSGEESQLFAMHPFIGSDLLSHIPRMETIAGIIANQEKHFDGSGFPLETKGGDAIPVGGRILRVVLDFDTLKTRGVSDEDALDTLSGRQGRYDPKVLLALRKALEFGHFEEVSVRALKLADGMILAEDLMMLDGRMLAARGYEVNLALRERIKNFSERPGLKEPLRVFVPAASAHAAHAEN